MADTARLSISLPRSLAARIRKAAAQDRAPVSAWIADAASAKLLLRNARAAIREHERQHGEITEAELRHVERAWGA